MLEDFTNALRPHELNSITVHKKVDIIMALYLKGTPVWQRARVWAWRLSTNLRAPHNQWFWECWFVPFSRLQTRLHKLTCHFVGFRKTTRALTELEVRCGG